MLSALLADMRERDFVSPERTSHRLGLPLADLARLAHVIDTRSQQPDSPAMQESLEPVVRFLAGAELLTGDADQAIVWFRHQPIAGPDGKTALHLVEGVHADAVLAHFEDLLDGNFE